jgi:hypothetical protein
VVKVALFHVDKTDFDKDQIDSGESQVILTCDCTSLECPLLYIQTDEFINYNERYLEGFLVDARPPTQSLWRRIKNSWRLIVGKNILWPDSMLIDVGTARQFAYWILDTLGDNKFVCYKDDDGDSSGECECDGDCGNCDESCDEPSDKEDKNVCPFCIGLGEVPIIVLGKEDCFSTCAYCRGTGDKEC